MAVPDLYPRYVRQRVLEALDDSPVVLIHGPRQCGKTTLARQIGDIEGHVYLSFDDDVQRAAAEADPVGYVAELPDKAILDEVQRVPSLFSALKMVVDTRRTPGRFLMTGSANVLLVPRLADSLAGRMAILRLHPLSQAEVAESEPSFWSALFAGSLSGITRGRRLGAELAERAVAGGFPAALARTTERRRVSWYRDYVETLVQRDIRDLRQISALDVLPRVLEAAAGQTARLLNISDLAGPFQVSRTTIREYVTLLSGIFLLEELQPWHSNRLKRLIKTPKLHFGDTGLACALLGIDSSRLWDDRSLYGQIVETFVYQELRRQASWQEDPISLRHFRDKDKVEIDVIAESGRKIAGIEVKAASTVVTSDFNGLRRLQAATGSRFASGVVLYDGDAAVPFGKALYAVPISSLWKGH